MRLIEYLIEDNRKHPQIKKKKFKFKEPPKPKPRPNKNLWFNTPEYWHEDLRMEKGTSVVYHEDEEENIYATDPDSEKCYGYWNKQKNGGMTFAKPIPFSHYNHKRRTMKEIK